MRLAPALVLVTLLATAPALAQDATTPAPADPAAPAVAPLPVPELSEIGPNADRDFWCALAFSLTSRAADIGGNAEASAAEAQRSQVIFASIITEMKAKNFQEEQFNALTARYTIQLMDPFGPAEGRQTREACAAAVTDAQSVMDALAAATPAEPEAPAADAPATP
jgi:hypothetical protein